MNDLLSRAVASVRLLDVQISPDGRQVAYVTAEASKVGDAWPSAIWLVDTQGGPPRRLTTSEAADDMPRWSPDGRWLAFTSDRRVSGTQQLYLLSRDGGEGLRITDRPTGVGSFAWSPDSRMIAFLSRDEEPETEERREER